MSVLIDSVSMITTLRMKGDKVELIFRLDNIKEYTLKRICYLA